MRSNFRLIAIGAIVVSLVGGILIGRFSGGLGGGGALAEIAADRGLTVEQATGALKAFTAPGEWDPYILVSSGGHSGQLHLVGVPSMRLLKTIPVFTPESWSGYGQGADWSEGILAAGSTDKQAAELAWGDTHHPALSETEGAYDGRFVYINDRANGRLGMVDLRDFKVKQILDLPNMQTSHGGVFATPNTEYVHISSMTPMPQTDDGYAPLEDYAEDYRGISTWVAIDPETGRADLDDSFQIELPPYTQDLADAGKLASDGWAFINSYNSEMAVGGKLDPHVTIYDIELIEKAIAEENFDGTDEYGVPILKFDAVVAGSVEVGLGPLHTQYDGRGHGYVSLFLDSAIAEFSLGPKAGIPEAEAFQLVDKVQVNYNVGHLATTEGDTVAADGQYLVALNKWSVDRFPVIGTLKPQNFQLIDQIG